MVEDIKCSCKATNCRAIIKINNDSQDVVWIEMSNSTMVRINDDGSANVSLALGINDMVKFIHLLQQAIIEKMNTTGD